MMNLKEKWDLKKKQCIKMWQNHFVKFRYTLHFKLQSFAFSAQKIRK